MDLLKRVREIDAELARSHKNSTLSTSEVSKILGVHPKTTQSYVRDKRIKASRVGKRYRYLREEVARFLAYSENSN